MSYEASQIGTVSKGLACQLVVQGTEGTDVKCITGSIPEQVAI